MNVGERLRAFVGRFETLQEQIDALKADQKDILTDAKDAGFDVRTIRDLLRVRKEERKDGRAAVEERAALLDVYKAALGMLYDTPLGEAARRRFSFQPAPANKPPADPGATALKPDPKPAPPPDLLNALNATDALLAIDLAGARDMGRRAAQAGQPVTDNPFPAGDTRRAAWDEAWCQAAGTDGMDIPEAWRRKKPKKPGSGPANDERKAG